MVFERGQMKTEAEAVRQEQPPAFCLGHFYVTMLYDTCVLLSAVYG